MANPAVSVIVPAYDPGPSFLRVALEAVVEQTCQDWEAVVVDDGGSQDLSWVSLIDERIRLIRQTNRGVSAARNHGIAATSGALVAFLDQDDVWHREKLAAQLREMAAQRDAPVCSTDFERIDAEGNRIGAGYHENFFTYQELLRGDGLCTSTTVVRRAALELVGGFDERYRYAPDWDLWLRLSSRVGRFTRVDRCLVGYRLHDRNESLNYAGLLAEGTEILRHHRAGPERRTALEGERRLRRMAGAQAYDAFRATRRSRALVDALRFDPRYTVCALWRYALSRPAWPNGAG
jgi:glycosyltransferase involved in cell wall biosynthesis